MGFFCLKSPLSGPNGKGEFVDPKTSQVSHPNSWNVRRFCQKFRKGVGGRGLATSSAQNTARKGRGRCPLLTAEDRKKGAEKRPESVG